MPQVLAATDVFTVRVVAVELATGAMTPYICIALTVVDT